MGIWRVLQCRVAAIAVHSLIWYPDDRGEWGIDDCKPVSYLIGGLCADTAGRGPGRTCPC